LSNRRVTLIFVATLLVAGLIAAVAIMAYRLGQQAVTVNLATSAETEASGAAIFRPTATRTPVPPRIVTNTPTTTRTPSPTPGPSRTPTTTPTNTPTPTPTPITVITHIIPLGRLETTEFAMRTIVDLANEPTTIWENIFGTDSLTLIAEGEVVGGVDLNKVEPNDIEVQGTSVRIVLPAPEILYSRIDNERTRVYERKTGLFRQLDNTLEGRARYLAEQSLREWAIERKIYEKAEASTQVQIESLLRSLGFTEITIEFKAEPPL
jgi:hypothetical protein